MQSIWFHQIPTDWSVGKLKHGLLKNTGGAWGFEPKDDGKDRIVLRSTEQTVEGHWKIIDPAYRFLSDKEYSSTRLEEGDLLITKSSGSELHIGKTSLVDKTSVNASYSNFMQRLRLIRI